MELKGLNGTVVFDGEFVTIRRVGFAARAAHGGGETRIPVGAIATVEWRAPTRLNNGWIAFVSTGGKAHEKRVGSRLVDASKDPNAVTLRYKHLADAEALRDAVDRARAGVDAGPSGAAEVERLAGLHAAGHLTDEEFTAAKAKALGL